MGNTIVCPLSAESRGDRDSSGHRRRRGGRPAGLNPGGRRGRGEGGERGGGGGDVTGGPAGRAECGAGGEGTRRGSGITEHLGLVNRGDRLGLCQVRGFKFPCPPPSPGSQQPATPEQNLRFTSLGPEAARGKPEGEVDTESGPRFSLWWDCVA